MCEAPLHISSFTPVTLDRGKFAFARIQGEIYLVQGKYPQLFLMICLLIDIIFLVSSMTPASALTTVDVKIFRHEFITIFRLLTTKTLHPSDIQIIENIDDQLKYYEQEKETVFLAKNVMERLRKLTLPVFPGPSYRAVRSSRSRR